MKHDLTGKRFGSLVVLEDAGERTKAGNVIWLCECDCGNTTKVRGSHLIEKDISSCGCKQHSYAHGQTDTRLYHIWCTMKARCSRKTSQKYNSYGGRGVNICEAWKNDFMEFYRWSMENGYADDLSIDRIDNDGDYCPENCRWATVLQQANNTRKNHIVTVNGNVGTISEMARYYGYLPRQIYKRLSLGWTVEKAFTVPIGSSGR